MTLTVCEYENIDLLLMLPTTPVKNWFKHMEQNTCTISNLLKKIWFMEGFFMAAAVTRPSKYHIVFNTDSTGSCSRTMYAYRRHKWKKSENFGPNVADKYASSLTKNWQPEPKFLVTVFPQKLFAETRYVKSIFFYHIWTKYLRFCGCILLS